MNNKITPFVALLIATSAVVPAAVNAQPKNVAKPITITGIVSGNPKGNQINVRYNGTIYKVTALPEVQMNKIAGGDKVRVWGIPTRYNLQRANVRVLSKAFSANPDDYNDAR